MLQASLISARCSRQTPETKQNKKAPQSKPVCLVGSSVLSVFFEEHGVFQAVRYLAARETSSFIQPNGTKVNQLSINRLFTPCHQLAHSQPPCLRLSAGEPGFLPTNDLPAVAAAEKKSHKSGKKRVRHVVVMVTTNSFLQSLLENRWRDGTRRGSCLKDPLVQPPLPSTTTTTLHPHHISRAAARMPQQLRFLAKTMLAPG